MARSTLPAADLARVVVFAAFIGVLGLFPGVPVGGLVPIVLQNLGPLLAGAILGWRRGTAAVALFLAVVAIGLPLLSGGRGGLAPFVGPSSGFIFGWLLSALVTGLIVEQTRQKALPVVLLATFLGLIADYLLGVPVYGLFLGSLGAGVVQSLVFVPGDLVKVVLAAVVATLVHRALPDLLPARRSARRPAEDRPVPAATTPAVRPRPENVPLAPWRGLAWVAFALVVVLVVTLTGRDPAGSAARRVQRVT